jgi:hypothetical protein
MATIVTFDIVKGECERGGRRSTAEHEKSEAERARRAVSSVLEVDARASCSSDKLTDEDRKDVAKRSEDVVSVEICARTGKRK